MNNSLKNNISDISITIMGVGDNVSLSDNSSIEFANTIFHISGGQLSVDHLTINAFVGASAAAGEISYANLESIPSFRVYHDLRASNKEAISQQNFSDWSDISDTAYNPHAYFQPRIFFDSINEYFQKEVVVNYLVLTGLGGAGKSSLATQLAHRKEREDKQYNAIRWMSMDTTNMERSLHDLADDLGITAEQRKLEGWQKKIRKRLEKQTWLIIWDNVDDYASVEKLLPHFTSTKARQHLLITSRDNVSWTNAFEVDIYNLTEATQYIENQMVLAKHAGFNRVEAGFLAETVGRHPLALELAMANICTYQRSLRSYLDELETKGIILQPWPKQKLDYQARLNNNTLNTLWSIGLSHLPSDSVLLLRFISFLNSKNIRRELLLNYFDANETQYNEAILALRGQSLIKRLQSSLEYWSIHSLLQDVIREDAIQSLTTNEQSFKNFMARCQTVLLTFFNENQKQSIQAIQEGVSHGNSFLSHTNKLPLPYQSIVFEPNWKKAYFLNTIAENENILADYASAERNLIQAEDYWKSIHSVNSWDPSWNEISACIKTWYLLGIIYLSKHELDKASTMFRFALITYQSRYGEEGMHPDIAAMLFNIGRVHFSQDDYENAYNYYTQALDMFHKTGVNDAGSHALIAVLNGLGNVFFSKKDYIQAGSFYTQALEMNNSFYEGSEKNIITANIIFSLGNISYSENKYDDAYDYYTQALTMYRSTNAYESIKHPSIALVLYSLGIVSHHKEMPDFPAARIFYSDALSMHQEIYGDTTHPHTAKILSMLGETYCIEKNLPKAHEYYAQALSVYLDKRNEDNINLSDKAFILCKLGSICLSQYNYTDAREHYTQALNIYLNFDDKTVSYNKIIILSDLGRIFNQLEDYVNAHMHFSKALKLQYDIYGKKANRADIATVLLGLGNTYFARNDDAKAGEHYFQALTMYRSDNVHGKEAKDSNIAIALHGLGNYFLSKHNYRDAIDHFEQALSMYYSASVYGENGKYVEIGLALYSLGNAFFNKKEYPEAIKYFMQALIAYPEATTHFSIGIVLDRLGKAHMSINDYPQAYDYYTKALEMYAKIYGENAIHHRIAETLQCFGSAYQSNGEYLEAQTKYNHALRVNEAIYQAQNGSHPNIACLLYLLGVVTEKLKQTKQAMIYYRRAFEIYKKSPEEAHQFFIEDLRKRLSSMLLFEEDIFFEVWPDEPTKISTNINSQEKNQPSSVTLKDEGSLLTKQVKKITTNIRPENAGFFGGSIKKGFLNNKTKKPKENPEIEISKDSKVELNSISSTETKQEIIAISSINESSVLVTKGKKSTSKTKTGNDQFFGGAIKKGFFNSKPKRAKENSETQVIEDDKLQSDSISAVKIEQAVQNECHDQEPVGIFVKESLEKSLLHSPDFFSFGRNYNKTEILFQKSQGNLSPDVRGIIERWDDFMLQEAISASLHEAYFPSKQSTSQLLQERALFYGCDMHNVYGDGNCFFYTLALKLYHSGKAQKDVNFSILQQQAQALRETAVSEIVSHPDRYRDFVLENKLEEIIIEAATNYSFVGQVVTQAMARALHVTIVVIPHDGGAPQIMRPSHSQDVIILGNEVNCHFQLLVPTGDHRGFQRLQQLIDRAPLLEILSEEQNYNDNRSIKNA